MLCAAVVLALAGVSASAQAPPSGVVATTVPVLLPGGLAYDSAGNLYIAATNEHVIRKVNTLGIITTVAGTGVQGFAGDGGLATSAELDSPVGLALDAANNIYIADTHNNRIREVLAATGVISTIAGTGVAGFSGDGGAALAAQFNYPTAIAVDSAANLYIADTNNHRIRKITGITISTVAGNGDQTFKGDGGLATATGLDSPNGVAVDANLNLYIGDTHNQRVRLVTAATGIITTFAGTGLKTYTADGGPASAAALARPRGVAVSPNGTVLIADSDNDRIRSVTGGTISTVGGDGVQGYSGDTSNAASASIDTPRAVTVTAQNNVVFSDTANFRVREVNGAGIIVTIAGVSPAGTESLTLTGAATTLVYGTGSLLATFSFNNNVATGNVIFYDVSGPTPVQIGAPVPLSSNTATLNASSLSAGVHSIEAVYPGDGTNAAVTSGVYVLTVTPLAITATANAATIQYGQPIPVLTGTLSGVLPQDSSAVTAVFSTTAVALSPAGTYPLSVTLTGSAAGNYTVTLAAPVNLTITPAGSQTVLTSTSAAPALGVPVTLTATVGSLTTGVPTGTINFYSGTAPNQVLLNATPIAVNSSGVAQFTTSGLPAGVLSITAVYSGDANFTPSTSAPFSETVTAAPFTFVLLPTATHPATQTVAPGGTATYTYNVVPGLATFPLPVSFTVSGLPAGASYTLTPSSIDAGAGTTPLTLVVKTTNPLAQLEGSQGRWLSVSLGLLLLPFGGFRRAPEAGLPQKTSRKRMLALMLLATAVLGGLTACGAGGFYGASPHTYDIVVTATSGPISESQSVTLIVQ